MAKRNFAVGNTMSGTTISQVGPATYTAKIVTTEYDPDIGGPADTEFPLVLGVVSNIECTLADSVKLVLTTNGVEKFTSVVTANYETIPTQPDSISYTFPRSNITDTSESSRKVKAVTAVYPKVVVGNDVDSEGNIIQVGDPTYTAHLRTSEYDPDVSGDVVQEFDLVLGVPLSVNLSFGQDVLLTCTPIAPYFFVSASYAGNEVGLTPTGISHTFLSAQMPPAGDDMRAFLIKTNGSTPPDPDTRISVNNNYHLTLDELAVFQKAIYASQMPEEKRPPAWNFVSEVYSLPFKIPVSEVSSRTTIKARDIEFGIADKLKSDYVILDVGTISIPKIHNNILDYKDVSIELFLPFAAGSESLDVDDVMGEEISIQYVVGVTSGDCTLNIFNSEGVLIKTSTFKMGSKYPFFSYAEVAEKLYEPANVINNIATAYVYIKTPDYSQSPKSKVTVSGNLEGVVGYVEFSEVSIGNIPYADEYSELVSKLKNGVIIK